MGLAAGNWCWNMTSSSYARTGLIPGFITNHVENAGFQREDFSYFVG